MFKNLTSSMVGRHDLQHQADLYRKLMRHEAQIGGTLFGPLPPGRRREFFCLDEHTWVWHEEWVDAQGLPRYVTTRYDIKPGGIIKSQNGTYLDLTDDEEHNVLKAARMYRQKVYGQIYAPLFQKASR